MFVDDSDKQFRRHTFDTVFVTIVLVVDVGDDDVAMAMKEAGLRKTNS